MSKNIIIPNRRYWTTMLKNRSVGRSSPFNSFIPSALHQNITPNNNQQHSSSRNNKTSSHRTRTSLPVFNTGLQKTFATG